MAQLSDKLKRLNEAVRELATVSGQDLIMERILDVVQQVFGRRTAAVLLRDRNNDHLFIAASRGYRPEVVEAYRAELGKGVAGTVARTGRARLVADVRDDPDYVQGVSDAVSEMAVPLNVEGEVIGVLDVESADSAFGDEDMALLEAFGEQAAWALRHGRAREEAEERARRLDLLNRAARALNAVHDPDALLERILELAHDALGFDNVAILEVDRAGEALEVRKALGRRDVEGLRIPVAEGIAGAVFRSGEAEIVGDVGADARYIAGGLEGLRSELCAPLKLDGEIIGVLDAEAAGRDAFGPLDLEVFSAFAAQVATALRNASQMTELEQRARRLRLVTHCGHLLNTILDADELLEEILEAASKALGLDRAAVLLHYAESSELVVHATRGYGPVLGKRIPMGRGITGSVALSGKPALVNDVGADERYVQGVVEGAAEMAVPMRVYGELFGVLDTESPVRGAFTEQDLELFKAFADQAAVALHNARQFRRLETANERLRKNVDEMSRLNAELETYARQISEANVNLESQIRQLTTLHQAGQAITSSLDLSATLSAILSMGSDIVASSAAAIKLMDAETKELKIAASSGMLREDTGSTARYDLPLKIGERTIGVFELMRHANQRLNDDERQLLETLASQAAIAIENARLFEDTQRVYYETLKSLAKALEARDDYTRGHSERVAELSLAVAHELELPEEECSLIYNSALLHDIGKIGVRDSILLAPRALTDEERAVIRKHPSFGNAILGPLRFLGSVSVLVKHHHERWDGKGYPDGLAGEQIPLASRIISVADTYDAMTSSRPYRAARTHEAAVEEIRAEASHQLDPTVVQAFLRVIARRRADCAERLHASEG